MRLLLSGTLALTALLLLQDDAAADTSLQVPTNADTGWTTDRPLTGRAISCDSGRIKGFECHNVELLAYLPKATLGGATGYDLWGWHDSTTGREFVIIGGESTAFVDVTDPVNPKYLGTLPPHSGQKATAAQSVKVYQHYAFIGYETSKNGIQIFDLIQLRDVKDPKVFQETAHYDGVTNTHTIAMNSKTGFAYVNGSNTCGSGLHMIDVRTPLKPTFVGCYTETRTGARITGAGYVHDTQCVIYHGPDQQYRGREICVNSSGAAIGIADVTDKKQPKTISVATYPNIGYVHQGWFTEDQRYFFVDDELDENPSALAFFVGQSPSTSAVPRTRTIVFDMTDLDDPVVLTEYFATTTGMDHNLYILGRYMFQANYRAGLRIIDIIDPKQPKEVGYLTKAGEAWGTYPYLKNDVVAVSTTQGLILARLKAR